MLTSALDGSKAGDGWSAKWRAKEFCKPRLPLIGMLAALLAFTVIAASSFYSLFRMEQQTLRSDHTYQVLSGLDGVFSLLKDTQSTARVFANSGNLRMLSQFEHEKAELARNIDEVGQLIADNPDQQKNLLALTGLIDYYVDYLQSGTNMRLQNKGLAASEWVAGIESAHAMDRIRAQVELMKETENKLLAQRSETVQNTTRETRLLIIFGTAGAYLMMGSAFWLLRREKRRRQMADEALQDANQALTSHAQQLEATNKELESFSYSISHDLRIPLRAISGYARMMEEDYADQIDSEGQRLLKVITDNSRQMGALIDDLLAFSRLGRKEISAGNVDMTGLARGAAADLQQKGNYPEANITVGPLPPAWGDRALLQQVWVNLISNALKYSANRDCPEIRIGADSVENEIIYHVSDNGIGFDMQYYSKLFGVFQRLHNADAFPGTGVGLAIVQRIVVRHGGRIWAEGQVGKGATFSFALPVKRGIDG